MDDDVPPAVEFLGGASGAGAEEVLAAPPASKARITLIVLVGGLLFVAAVGAAIGRSSDGGDKRGARRAGPAAAAGAAVTGPVPVARGQDDADSSALTECPADAECSVWVHAPAATLEALRAAFPRAVLHTANTVLANRAGHFEPDLLRRMLVAQDGSRTIRIGIRVGSASRPASARDRPATGPRIEVSAHRAGYRICVAVSGPGAGEASPRATRLAADARLLAPL